MESLKNTNFHSINNILPYKEPVFLFTSSSMRKAAYAGWYSAFGDIKKTKEFIHEAHAEWVKEIGAGRKYYFTNLFNNDIYKKVNFDKLKKLTDKYLLDIKKEIKNNKGDLLKEHLADL